MEKQTQLRHLFENLRLVNVSAARCTRARRVPWSVPLTVAEACAHGRRTRPVRAPNDDSKEIRLQTNRRATPQISWWTISEDRNERPPPPASRSSVVGQPSPAYCSCITDSTDELNVENNSSYHLINSLNH
ncbi:hypothetical protein EVAR_98222_1 [Eumeta japonica]|uniref:Uncharacterized protein n=1 Tax=Eumeta variegata TaxID=151549 RepID=A0A4C1Y739_EUMVA|nr:hypothetical protein EVAR_98222_1 [Eumeta japonica]